MLAGQLDRLGQDMRFGARTLMRHPGWTIVAMTTLALGIGANAAMFSVVNNVLLYPLPYPDAGRIVLVQEEVSLGGKSGKRVAVLPEPATVRVWRNNARLFDDLQGFLVRDVTLLPQHGTASTHHAALVRHDFNVFAGQQPLIGRMFTETDIASGAPVVLIAEGLWRGRFGSDSGIVGRSVVLGDSVHHVIGVMPASLTVPSLAGDAVDFWMPLDERLPLLGLAVVGRLRPQVTVGEAARELDEIERARLSESGAPRRDDVRTTVVRPGRLVPFGDSLAIFSAAVGLVLLIACANVTHLLLGRGVSRRREFAVRAALGAGPWRVARQLCTETLLLTLGGAIAAIGLGWLGIRFLLSIRPVSLVQLESAHLDARTLVAVVVLSAATGIVFGMIATWQSTRQVSSHSLRFGLMESLRSRTTSRTRSLLVVTEMALSTTLIIGTALLVRGVAQLTARDPGFEAAGLYTIDVSLPSSYLRGSRSAFFEQFTRQAAQVPAIQGISVADEAPPRRTYRIGALHIEGEQSPRDDATSFIEVNGVRSDYFRVLGLRFVRGGVFRDTSAATDEVIVNESLARAHWPDGSALGRRLRVVYAGQGEWRTIVGVVRDVATGGLASDPDTPTLYVPGPAGRNQTVIMRTRDAEAAAVSVRGIVAAIDRRLPPPEIRAVQDAMWQSISAQRFTMLLLTVFSSVALVLATVGLYGVLAYTVTQRTREIGIRIALGATRARIAREVLAEGLFLASAGLVVGLLTAYWVSRVVASIMTGISSGDALSFVIAAILLLLTSAIACAVPARRAMSVEPGIAMRTE